MGAADGDHVGHGGREPGPVGGGVREELDPHEVAGGGDGGGRVGAAVDADQGGEGAVAVADLREEQQNG